MTIPSNRKELFRASTTRDKLTLFQLLFDAQLLTTDLSLALLKIIHDELSADKEYDRSLYKRYAESIETLRYYMFDVFRQVMDAWKRK
jgi:hypothetical protein